MIIVGFGKCTPGPGFDTPGLGYLMHLQKGPEVLKLVLQVLQSEETQVSFNFDGDGTQIKYFKALIHYLFRLLPAV